jgi:hypothetical protein
MEPTPNKNKTDYKLTINWTQDYHGWSNPAARKEIQKLCDQLYVDLSSKQSMAVIEQIDQSVTGDYHPKALELIMSAYQKYKKV